MGRKDKQAQQKTEQEKKPEPTEAVTEEKPKKEEEKDKPEPEEEDPPVVKELKVLDDKYLEIEREYEKEVEQLKKKYLEQKKPLLEERAKLLVGEGDAKEGTPKLSSFWRKAMANHPAFEDTPAEIQEWDEPVMDYLRDVAWEPIKEDDGHSFKLTFTFVENPYFEPQVVTKEYHCEEASPYTQEIDVKKIVCTEIKWHPNKDVTVEKTQKKVKGGGAKKAKQKGKETIEPRNSVFRSFFRSLDSDGPLPDDLKQAMMEMEDEDDDSDDEMVQMFMENDYETGCALKDQIIPFAVRWYTGEAAPDDDSDDEDSEEEDDDDDEDDDDESEDEPPRGRRGNKNKAGNKSKASPKIKPADAPKEECKQQ